MSTSILKVSILGLILPFTIFAQTTSSPESQQLRQCIESLCGPANQNFSAYDAQNIKFQHTTPAQKQAWETQWKPFIQGNLQWEAQNQFQIYARMDQIVRGGTRPQLSNPLHPLLVLISYLGKFQDKWESAIELTDRGYQFSESKLLQAFLNEPVAVQNAAIAIAKYYLQPTFVISNYDLQSWLMINYKSTSIKEAQIAFATNLNGKIDRLKKQFPVIPFEIFFRETQMSTLNRAKAGEELSALDSDDLLELFNSVFLIDSTLTSSALNQALLKTNEDFSKNFDAKKVLEEIKKKTAILKNAEGIILTRCEGKVLETMSKDLTPSKKAYTLGMISEIKSAAKKVMARLVSPGSYSTIETKINNAQFSLPEPPQGELNRFKQEVAASVNSGRKLAELAKSRRDADFDQVLLTFLLLNASDKEQEFEIPSEIKSSCDDLQGYNLSDYSLSSLGKISVSHFTVAVPEIGVSVLAHELGHVLSDAVMSQNRVDENLGFYTSRSCVNNRNPFEKNKTTALKFSDGTWTEEDWADHFSTLVLKELQQSRSPYYTPKNMACSLVRDIGAYYEDKTLENDPEDPHSSGPLRLILMAIDRDQMTPQCQPLLKPSIVRCEGK